MLRNTMTHEIPPPDTSEDLALVARLRAGDEDAFDHFAATYHTPLLRYVLSCLDGDIERSRDLVQTALCKAIGKLDSYRGEATLFTWLRACCRNEVLMLLRKRRSGPRLVELEAVESTQPEAGFWHAHQEPADRRLLEAERRAAVHGALDLLPERYAKALEWKYLESLPVKEIALRLGLSAKAAESLLTRARGAFKSRFTESLQHPTPLPTSRGSRDEH